MCCSQIHVSSLTVWKVWAALDFLSIGCGTSLVIRNTHNLGKMIAQNHRHITRILLKQCKLCSHKFEAHSSPAANSLLSYAR